VRELMNRAFSLASLTFAVLLVLTMSVRFSGYSLARTATWAKVWGDEFNGPAGSSVNTSNWLSDTSHGYGCSGCPANWGTSEVESMSDSTANVYQDGKGHLVVKAIRDASGNWTSGRIETQRTDFAAPPGGQLKITASLQQPSVPSAAGYWPAFWMLGSQFRGNYLNWPGVGEVDIMEDVNGRSGEFATLHCGVAPGGPCNEFTGLSSGQSACAGCQSAFHTYTAIIDRSVSPEQIRWYLDGVNFFKVSADQVPASAWSAAVDHPFFIILNLAIGGAFPLALGGGQNPTTASGGSLKVDYVRVYTANGTVTPTSTTGGDSTVTSPPVIGGGSTLPPEVTAGGSMPSTRTFTFVNNTSQTIWAAALGNSSPGDGGWVMAPNSTHSVTVANTWSGRFWGRTNCNFNSSGAGSCETGDCAKVLHCTLSGLPPATLAEFTLGGPSGNDFYDVSLVDGFNVPMTITPVGGVQPVSGNKYWCGAAGCGTDLNAHCPSVLQETDASGRIVACKSACTKFNTDLFCCRGAHSTPETCVPSTWPVDYAAYFKSGCLNAYSYPYDDPTSTFLDKGASFKITFGPAKNAGGNPTSPPPSTVKPLPPSTQEPTPRPPRVA